MVSWIIFEGRERERERDHKMYIGMNERCFALDQSHNLICKPKARVRNKSYCLMLDDNKLVRV
jgi:hypothetical protein